jgi:hypothetical protein
LSQTNHTLERNASKNPSSATGRVPVLTQPIIAKIMAIIPRQIKADIGLIANKKVTIITDRLSRFDRLAHRVQNILPSL